jgi:CheY-like chemotaxis protein
MKLSGVTLLLLRVSVRNSSRSRSKVLKKEMILIADDNADVRRMLCSLVEDNDTEIIEVTNGAEAIQAYELHHPEWVLMDINMRPTDGLTAMRAILEKDPGARVIIVSQHQDKRTRETAVAMGAHAFVGKSDLMKLQELLADGTGL